MKLLDEMSNTAKAVSAIAGIVVLAFTVYTGIDTWKADAQDFRQFKALYDCDQLRAERNDLRDQIWKLEDTFGVDCRSGNEANKDEYKKLQLDLADVEKELEGCRVKRR